MTILPLPRGDMTARLRSLREEVAGAAQPFFGKVVSLIGTLARVTHLPARCGDSCHFLDEFGRPMQRGEVVGFVGDETLVMAFGSTAGIARSTLVRGTGLPLRLRVGTRLLGRVVDALGDPMDGQPALRAGEWRPVMMSPVDPLSRPSISQPLPTGVRCIDALMPIGRGQRVGVFAPAGTGKTTLVGMLVRSTRCDVVVIALIGERGRELAEWTQQVLGAALKYSVVVCATSDRSALERWRAAHTATSIAEYFRDQGRCVLLVMDSLTRFARAQREIGLAIGEPPARRGYPPSVFAELPRLLERAGSASTGSITGIYTVLSEDVSNDDPIAEEARSLLDGHIVLSRKLAESGHFPAVDPLASLSRVMPAIAPQQQCRSALQLRRWLTKREELAPLVQLGEYQIGRDPEGDEALSMYAPIQAFLAQETDEVASWDATQSALCALAGTREELL